MATSMSVVIYAIFQPVSYRSINVVYEHLIECGTFANFKNNALNAIGGFTEDGLARALEIDDERRSLELPTGLV